MRYLVIICILVCSACAGTSIPDSSKIATISATLENLETTIDAIVHDEMEETHLPGVAVVIVHEGKTIIKKGYGMADVATKRPVDPDSTLFRIGSVSKALTALALTRLVDNQRINLYDDVTKYFNQITNLSGSDEPVTVWNLLTHTGGFDQIGLDRHIYDFEKPLEERKAQRPSLSDYLGNDNLRRVTPPGELFRYDTYGITLAGHILEQVTGLNYASAMKQELFNPLGMNASFVEADDEHIPHLAIGHGWVDSTYVQQPYEIYVTTPASSIDATPADMALLLEAITGEGANKHGRLFSMETATAVLSQQYRSHPRFTGITHGLWESPSMDPPEGPFVHSVGHGGSMLGFWTLFEIFTEKNVGVFIATNRNHEAGGGSVHIGTKINLAILNALYEETPTAPATDVQENPDLDLKPYAGEYAYGTFCKSCTRSDFARGAWRVWNTLTVAVQGNGLLIEDAFYLPTAEPDVFVSEAGSGEVFFGRNAENQISFYVTSDGPATFERIPALTEINHHLLEAEGLVKAGSVNEAQEAIEKALSLGLDKGLYSEHTINALGYQYLQNHLTAIAIHIFRFNTYAFPESWNVHDSLGEAFIAAERYPEAIKAYEQSVKLNPDSETGKIALNQLKSR